MKLLTGLIVFGLLGLTPQAHAQTLLVSDIDDTIKISHVLDTFDMVGNANETKNLFAGMSQLYALLKQQKPDLEIVYLSAAPEWLMQRSHAEFLHQNKFPKGDLILRDDLDKDKHKLWTLRKILQKKKYSQLILVGDNGEQDPEIYDRIRREFPDLSIQTYIHMVYSRNSSDETGAELFKDQVAWVTPVDIAYHLWSENTISEDAMLNFSNRLIPTLIKLPLSKDEGVLMFPNWQDCSDYRWEIKQAIFQDLKELVLRRCR